MPRKDRSPKCVALAILLGVLCIYLLNQHLQTPTVTIKKEELGLQNTPSPHSDQHSRRPKPKTAATKEEEKANDSGHYTYLVVVGTQAQDRSRRHLIRSKYFGLDDNLLPCMHYTADVYYTFWIHGPTPHTNTPLKREYESEKIEWNDMVEFPTFQQSSIFTWAESLALRNITYDYLILQDRYSFVQLNTIKKALESRTARSSTSSPLHFVWGVLSNTTQTVIAGASAVRYALAQHHTLQPLYPHWPLFSAMYTHNINSKDLPEFIQEDGPKGTRRFIHWENNVESVHPEDIVVREVYQDKEFSTLCEWTYLIPMKACHQHSMYAADRPLLHPMDEDQHVPIDSSGGKSPTMAIVTSSYIYNACMEPSAALAAKNKRDYALQHNYAFVARSAEFAQQSYIHRRPVWGKIDTLEKVLPKYDWVFWLDMDAIIMNPNITLDSLIHRFTTTHSNFSQVNWVVVKPTHDPMINAGVLLIRNTPWTMQFLRDLQGMTEWYQKGPSYEQGAMWKLLQQPQHQPHVLVLEGDHFFNTFPRRYKKDDFVVHFAPDKCPNDAVMKGLLATDRLRQGHYVTVYDIE
ncbi:galactosyl transferase GMA12/MNN10 family-domain-containing protein [Spinellus fusiger]|nr:galactosyl transferase GMA12/MNN10 family-domain-containing protein [Spinellus fusiger]